MFCFVVNVLVEVGNVVVVRNDGIGMCIVMFGVLLIMSLFVGKFVILFMMIFVIFFMISVVDVSSSRC